MCVVSIQSETLKKNKKQKQSESLSFLKQLDDHPLEDGAILGTECRVY